MQTFNVTFCIVTEESAKYGDFSESGYISENGTLRDAISDVLQSSNTTDTRDIEAGDRWLSVNNGMDWISGEYETRSLHRPNGVTDSSWSRICRLVV